MARLPHGAVDAVVREAARKQRKTKQPDSSGIRLFDGGMESRTPDILLAKQALYQLSYAPEIEEEPDFSGSSNGSEWTRTTDLRLIRAPL